ncbi:MAG TPA: hypothetical protein VFO30_01645 [Chthoniobacterales bacterium]|nr:hypothetical protein [Chthoniobacterales bacterium]
MVPRPRVFPDHPHGIAGINHFRKDDEISARAFRARRQVAELSNISIEIAQRARDLGGGDFHMGGASVSLAV